MPDPPSERRRLVSFDGSTHIDTTCFAPDRYRFWDVSSPTRVGISRGAGLSYAAASFGRSLPSIEHRSFNRFLDFDSDTLVLEVESGTSLGRVYEFAIRRGLALAVQPGHPSITIGGCIAADVHGKNQFRDGTFVNQVKQLRLYHPDHGVLEVDRGRNPDLFYLTCGGYGLTGNILSARLQLIRLPSLAGRITRVQLGDISELPAAMERGASSHDLYYSWHNFTATDSQFGSGFVVLGSFSRLSKGEAEKSKGRLQSRGTDMTSRLQAETRGFPFPFFNSVSTRIFNRLYQAFVRIGTTSFDVEPFEFFFPVHNKETYFHLFGKRGFHEYQLLVPKDRFLSFVDEVKRRLRTHPVGVTLASAKLFGGASDLLRFSGDGICLAINFPRDANGHAFAKFLDKALLRCGGKPNLIKDSRLSASIVAAAYPEYEVFRTRLRSFDPRLLYRSEMSERLGL